MQNAETILKNTLGLTETEVKIYTAGLAYTSVGAQELAKITRVKRPTVYHALQTLLYKGLAAKKTNSRKLVYTMTRPDKVQKIIDKKITDLKQQQSDLAEAIPFLSVAASAQGVNIAHFEGVDGVKAAFEELIYCKSRRWDEIGPVYNFIQAHRKDFLPYFLKQRKDRGIVARTLWESLEKREFLSKEDLKTRNARLLPANMRGRFTSMLFLFDDKILLVSPPEELSAVLIQSKDLHALMESFFEGLYAVSEPIEKK